MSKKKTILIIDDQADFTEVLKWALANTGDYEVFVENDGARGLAAVKKFRPDLILLDVNMPDMEGPVVAEQVRADADLNTTPIVFLTSVVERKETYGKEQRVGNEFFLAKPSNLSEIIGCIERHIRK